MARNKNNIPTADEEALQQPTIDPIMLLTSMMSGGISSLQNSAWEKQLGPALRILLGTVAKEPSQIYGTAAKNAIGGGLNFAGNAALNHLVAPNHPLLDNYGAFPIFPTAGSEAVGALTGGRIANTGENILKNFPALQNLFGRLKPLLMTPALLRKDKKDAK